MVFNQKNAVDLALFGIGFLGQDGALGAKVIWLAKQRKAA